MNIIILVAGQGSRFYEKNTPKCLMNIDSQTVIERLLTQISTSVLNSNVTIVVGFQKKKIIDHVRSLKIPNLKIQFITNDTYQTDTNGVSLLLSLEENEDTYVFEGDCVYDPIMVRDILLSTSEKPIIFLKGVADKNQLNGVVQLDSNQNIKRFLIGSKENIRNINSCYNMVGVLWIPRTHILETKFELKNQNKNQYYFIPFIFNILTDVYLLPEQYKMMTFNTQYEYIKTVELFGSSDNITFEPLENLHHIEDFSEVRVKNLYEKIKKEGIWNKPVCVDKKYKLIMDGQHRYEAAKLLGLKEIPVMYFNYNNPSLKIYSLRPEITFTKDEVIKRSIKGIIYPYKTVKHIFPNKVVKCSFKLEELK